MPTIWQDLRYSARLLLKHPGFTASAVGVLTFGIGVNAGVFGIINGPHAGKMFLTLGLAGTFVAVIGLYGVRSYLVSRRMREFGVRMAIGASPADVLSLVLRESLAITIVGLTIALGLAMLLGWGLRVAIYQISPLDPVAFGPPPGFSRSRRSRRHSFRLGGLPTFFR
jgi:ABC-type antimicrobial peptide transport system permease subunit